MPSILCHIKPGNVTLESTEQLPPLMFKLGSGGCDVVFCATSYFIYPSLGFYPTTPLTSQIMILGCSYY